MNDQYDFSSLAIIEIPVVGPDGKRYMLREASGDAVAKFNNARARCIQFKDGAMASVSGQGDLEVLLVSYCLFHTDETGAAKLNTPVDIKLIRSWPNRVVKPLYDAAREISEIDAEDDLPTLKKRREELDRQIKQVEGTSAKNELSGTLDGSDYPES